MTCQGRSRAQCFLSTCGVLGSAKIGLISQETGRGHSQDIRVEPAMSIPYDGMSSTYKGRSGWGELAGEGAQSQGAPGAEPLCSVSHTLYIISLALLLLLLFLLALCCSI